MIFSKCKADHTNPCLQSTSTSLSFMGWSPNLLASLLNKSFQSVALNWGLWLWLSFLASSCLSPLEWPQICGGAKPFPASCLSSHCLLCKNRNPLPLCTLGSSITTSVMLFWPSSQYWPFPSWCIHPAPTFFIIIFFYPFLCCLLSVCYILYRLRNFSPPVRLWTSGDRNDS